MIAIIDYDIGNLAAVSNMLTRVGQRSIITSDPAEIEAADKIILPGNGHFDCCMQNLKASGLIPLLERCVLEEGTPLMGICVGAQMLGRSSEEGKEPGLGWFDMAVRRLPGGNGIRVPQMGWNEVEMPNPDHLMVQGYEDTPRYYFVHSYYMEPASSVETLMTTDYGISFAAAVTHKNIVGVQFHPEKSHRFGKQLLLNFAENFN